MSSLVIERCRIDKVSPHPNADKLELAVVKGWQLAVPKGKYVAGAEVVYVPPDSVLPLALSDRLGVTGYLSKGRVKCVKLRGEPSFGLLIDPDSSTPASGLAEHFGITKYAPMKNPRANWGGGGPTGAFRALPDLDGFPKYTNIENLRHCPGAFADGEPVVATEKIHGTNVRIGIVDGQWVAGSRNRRVSIPMTKRGVFQRVIDRILGRAPAIDSDSCRENWFTFPLSIRAVCDMIADISFDGGNVVLYGEVFGPVQGLDYGRRKLSFAAFDLSINGQFVSYDVLAEICREFGVDMAPVIYRGPYSIDAIKYAASGDTVMGGNHIREGVVVRPERERMHPKLGRMVLKYVSDAYLLGPDGLDTAEE